MPDQKMFDPAKNHTLLQGDSDGAMYGQNGKKYRADGTEVGLAPTMMPHVEDKPAPVGYMGHTRAQLLSMAKARGISVNPRMTKGDLVAILEAADVAG